MEGGMLQRFIIKLINQAVNSGHPVLHLRDKQVETVPLLLQENFEQKHDLVIEETELKQVAYIFSCNNSTVQIKGKINSIIVGELPANRA